ncbi:MAG TPA: NCS2 family permease, partial [Lachnoclostridium sp.]|nr:NCS2 family permease [Lachnoclostridium sp.]
MRDKLNQFFHLSERGTNIKTEILAGTTTFLTCVYIVAVNPGILSAAGMDTKAVFWATAVASAIACIWIGVWANLPLALAPAMGLNAYFTYYVCNTLGLPW